MYCTFFFFESMHLSPEGSLKVCTNGGLASLHAPCRDQSQHLKLDANNVGMI